MKSKLGAGAATIAVVVSLLPLGLISSATGAGQAGAQPANGFREASLPAKGGALGVCYSQLADDPPDGVVSQNFTDGESDQFDSVAADDFRLATRCLASQVQIQVIYSQPGSRADSWNVTFYRDQKRLPGKAFASQTLPAAIDNGDTVTLNLDPAVELKPGVFYWLSVQADMPASNAVKVRTKSNQANEIAVWRNPGDGYGTGCTTWTQLQECSTDGSTGHDLAMSIIGKISA